MSKKLRFKVGDNVKVLPNPDFSEKGKTLIGLRGKVISNAGDGHYDVMLFVDGQSDNVVTAYLPASALESVNQ